MPTVVNGAANIIVSSQELQGNGVHITVDLGDAVTVPGNSIFAMGDSRNHSSDSRK